MWKGYAIGCGKVVDAVGRRCSRKYDSRGYVGGFIGGCSRGIVGGMIWGMIGSI